MTAAKENCDMKIKVKKRQLRDKYAVIRLIYTYAGSNARNAVCRDYESHCN